VSDETTAVSGKKTGEQQDNKNESSLGDTEPAKKDQETATADKGKRTWGSYVPSVPSMPSWGSKVRCSCTHTELG